MSKPTQDQFNVQFWNPWTHSGHRNMLFPSLLSACLYLSRRIPEWWVGGPARQSNFKYRIERYRQGTTTTLVHLDSNCPDTQDTMVGKLVARRL